MKLQQRHRGFLAIEVTIPDFAVGAACGPVPTAWLTTLYRRDGSILYEFSSFLEDFRLYKTVPDSEFELSFPPGTTVLPRVLPGQKKPAHRGPLTRKGPIDNPHSLQSQKGSRLPRLLSFIVTDMSIKNASFFVSRLPAVADPESLGDHLTHPNSPQSFCESSCSA